MDANKNKKKEEAAKQRDAESREEWKRFVSFQTDEYYLNINKRKEESDKDVSDKSEDK